MSKKSYVLDDYGNLISKLYNVNDVKNGYNYWFARLLNITLSMFEYEGLPKSLPQREIELQLQLTGHCVIFERNGKLITTYVGCYDFDEYYQTTKGVYAQPILKSGNLTLNSFDNVRFYNSSLQDNIMGVYVDNSLLTFLKRYARRLADIEATCNIYTVNNRATHLPIAKNDNVKSSVKRFFEQIALGFREVISDDRIIESFTDIPIAKLSTNEDITKWQEARDKVLEQFFRDIGVKFRNPKKAQLNTEEVESDEQVLVISLDDMLKERQKGIEVLNDKFNLNVSVKINPKFDREIQKSFHVETLEGE